MCVMRDFFVAHVIVLSYDKRHVDERVTKRNIYVLCLGRKGPKFAISSGRSSCY